jgi:hypothetical protein
MFCAGLTILSAEPVYESEDELAAPPSLTQETVARAGKKKKSNRCHHRHHRPPGIPGPQGPRGPQGPKGSYDHLYVVNHSELPMTLNADTAIPFAGTPLSFGSAVSQLDSSKFSIEKEGRYFINFVGNTAMKSALGGVEIRVNGVSTGVTSNLSFGGAPLVVQQIVEVSQAPATLEVVVVGVGLSFSAGTSLSLSVMQLN